MREPGSSDSWTRGGEQPLDAGQMSDVETLRVQHPTGKHSGAFKRWSLSAYHRKDQGDLKDMFVIGLNMRG